MLEVELALRRRQFHLQASFSVGPEPLVLFGYSGSGKTTTLEAIAGLVRPDRGRITFDGRVLYDSEHRIAVPAHQRQVGYLVQDGALFPHLTVSQNIAFGLGQLDAPARRRRVGDLLDLLDLNALAEHRPHQISGGQRQRTALARALARESQILLLDEPFAALDLPIRSRIIGQLIELRRRLGLTMIYVTHDLAEAFSLSGKIAVYDAGRILQIGPGNEIYSRPASRRAAVLTGTSNVLEARVVGRSENETLVQVGPWKIATMNYPFRVGDQVAVCIRPQAVILMRHDRLSRRPENLVSGRIESDQLRGSLHTLVLRLDEDGVDEDLRLEVELPAHAHRVMGISVGANWSASLRRENLHLIPV